MTPPTGIAGASSSQPAQPAVGPTAPPAPAAGSGGTGGTGGASGQQEPAAGAQGAAGAAGAATGALAGAAAVGGEPPLSDAGSPDPAPPVDAGSGEFVLIPVNFPMYGDELTFPQTANPPTNQSPEFEWRGVPAGAKSLALVFRDLGNGAVKWILWDIPPTVTRVPPNVSKTAMPAEVPGASQLGSLNNQGYAGPGSGARQYDFKLWALDVERLSVGSRLTTVQIHDDILPMHEIATTPPVLLRNTRNLR